MFLGALYLCIPNCVALTVCVTASSSFWSSLIYSVCAVGRMPAISFTSMQLFGMFFVGFRVYFNIYFEQSSLV